MSDRHDILVIEDDPACAQTLCDTVRSMDMDCRLATTLAEAKAALAERLPCGILQDMQLPHAAGASPHEKAGETSIRTVRAISSGPKRIPIVVVTAFRTDPDFVWSMSELQADGFVAKANMGLLADKLIVALRKTGREDHAACAACTEESRVGERLATTVTTGIPRATLFAHDRHGAPIDAATLATLVGRRAEHDLFLDLVTEDARGHLAGHRDHAGVFHETWLGETSGAILAELVQSRRAMRADAIRCLRGGGRESAVRLVQKARQAVDVRRIVRGKESRTEWRAFHTIGTKEGLEFAFEPPVGMTYAVMVKPKG